MKHKISIFNKISIIFSICFLFISCKKDWLDAKPEKALIVPSTIRDYQALLDNTISEPAFNGRQNSLGEIGAGDFYVTDPSWNIVTPLEKNTYIWKPDIYEGSNDISGWSNAYNCILYTNIILEGIEKISPVNNAEKQTWSQVKGSCLFFRAYRHYDVAQAYCKVYDQNTASTDLGIPLRLESDFNIPSIRSSVEASYAQIINDLKQASLLLPISTPINTTYQLRPTKNAAHAMLARVYLSMGKYDSAFLYADKTLQGYNVLMDYNLTPPLLPSGSFRIPRFNPEVIFHIKFASYPILTTSRLAGDPNFYQSYDANDLRQARFWTFAGGYYRFTGSYDGSGDLFTGLATDEIYLIRAECYARMGNTTAAIEDLNTLIKKRWKNNGTWVPFTATDANDALNKILVERRKELCLRGIRWTDLRRLNKEPQFAVTLTRMINGTTYTLAPNSPLYVLPIPTNVIQLTGMQQNPR